MPQQSLPEPEALVAPGAPLSKRGCAATFVNMTLNKIPEGAVRPGSPGPCESVFQSRTKPSPETKGGRARGGNLGSLCAREVAVRPGSRGPYESVCQPLPNAARTQEGGPAGGSWVPSA